MFQAVSRLVSKFRLAKKSIQPFGCQFSWSRNYVGSQQFAFKFEMQNFAKNPACDVIEDDWDEGRGFKYMPVMAQAMYVNGMKSMMAYVDEMGTVTARANEKDLEKGFLKAYEVVRGHLERRARMISSFEEIAQVATVAANGDIKIVELIIKAMHKVGSNGLYFICDNKKSKYELEFGNGMNLDWGLISPFFLTDRKKQTCNLKNPLVLIVNDNQIFDQGVIKLVMDDLYYSRPLLVIVNDIEVEELGHHMQDWNCSVSDGLKLCIVKSLKPEEDRKAIMQDIAILTGGQVVTKAEDILSIEKFLGSCKEVRASYDKMAILGGCGGQAKADMEERCEQPSSIYRLQEIGSHYKGKLFERHAKLSGSATIIKICGANRSEVRKKNMRARNALAAAKAAMERGILPGGGVSLLHASKELDYLEVANSDQKLGVQLLQHVLKTPVYSIASTKGFNGLVVVEKLMEQDNLDLGYDPIRGEYVDLIKAGYVDPLNLILMELEDLVRMHSPTKLNMSSSGNGKDKRKPYWGRLRCAQYNKNVP